MGDLSFFGILRLVWREVPRQTSLRMTALLRRINSLSAEL
jgi:hypothetical protein